MSPNEAVHRFVETINGGDPERIAELLTECHRFVDPGGRVVEGREAMLEAWRGYLEKVPDYRIEVEETFFKGTLVVILGTARGTYRPKGWIRAGNAWSTPAAWRARVAGDLIAEWQVYADNEPIRRLMRGAAI